MARKTPTSASAEAETATPARARLRLAPATAPITAPKLIMGNRMKKGFMCGNPSISRTAEVLLNNLEENKVNVFTSLSLLRNETYSGLPTP